MDFAQFMNQYFEIIAAVIAFVYVVFQIFQSNWTWYLSIATAMGYLYVYLTKGIYAMSAMQVYLIVIGIYGIVNWYRARKKLAKSEDDKKDSSAIAIHKFTFKTAAFTGLVSLAVFIGMYYILKLTDDPSPMLDSAVSTLCMLATYYTSKAYIASWLVWIFCNCLSVYFYYTMGMIPTMILYLVYIVMAVIGYVRWKKHGVLVN